MPDGWVRVLQLGAVVPVEVTPGQRTPVVPGNDPIGVEHGDHLEHKELSEHLGSGVEVTHMSTPHTCTQRHLHVICVCVCVCVGVGVATCTLCVGV